MATRSTTPRFDSRSRILAAAEGPSRSGMSVRIGEEKRNRCLLGEENATGELGTNESRTGEGKRSRRGELPILLRLPLRSWSRGLGD